MHKDRRVDVGALTRGTLWICALWLLDTGGLKCVPAYAGSLMSNRR